MTEEKNPLTPEELKLKAREDFYDREIAPALAQIAAKCHAEGMSLIADVEFNPGQRGATYSMEEDSTLVMQMLRIVSTQAPNIDGMMIHLHRLLVANKIKPEDCSVFFRLAMNNITQEPKPPMH